MLANEADGNQGAPNKKWLNKKNLTYSAIGLAVLAASAGGGYGIYAAVKNNDTTPEPSFAPTTFPSFSPSAVPSTVLTMAPSHTPSAQPTFLSGSPSQRPSQMPSLRPSNPPSLAPSNTPSSLPSLSVAPSAQPTQDSLLNCSDPNNTGACVCTPLTYEFEIDPQLGCQDLSAEPGVVETACLVSPEENNVTDFVPVSFQSIQILEFNENLEVISQEAISGNFVEGDTFSYTSTALLNPPSTVKGIQVAVKGQNQQGQVIISNFLVTYTNECDLPHLSSNLDLGYWLRLKNLSHAP